MQGRSNFLLLRSPPPGHPTPSLTMPSHATPSHTALMRSGMWLPQQQRDSEPDLQSRATTMQAPAFIIAGALRSQLPAAALIVSTVDGHACILEKVQGKSEKYEGRLTTCFPKRRICVVPILSLMIPSFRARSGSPMCPCGLSATRSPAALPRPSAGFLAHVSTSLRVSLVRDVR